MNSFQQTSLVLTIILLNLTFLTGQYSISGQLVDSENKYKFITLELVPSINGLTATKMSKMVHRVDIDSTGYFAIEGRELPEEPMLYRLSIQKKGEGIGISTGQWKNHIHLVLHKNSNIELIGCEDISKTFGFCEVKGSAENVAIQDLYDNVLEAFWGEYKAAYETGSTLKKDLVYQNHNDILKTYCDTSSFLLPSLIAFKHIKTELDDDYTTKSEYYSGFLNKVMAMEPNSPYAIELKKMLYMDLDIVHGPKENKAMSYLHWVLLFLLFALGAYVVALRRQISRMSEAQASVAIVPVETRMKSLSKKEIEVFQHIKEGKSNKEIASLLYIEVNTVKSHISKIYQKLDIKSRKEALEISM